MDQQTGLKKQTAMLSVISNTLLVILKLVVGVYTGAVSIVSEAAHSAVDLIAALIAYYAVRQSGKPPDGNHAYGHGKIENLSGAVEAVLIIVAAIWIIWESVDKLGKGEKPEMLEYGIVIMGISIAANYWVSEKLMTVAKQTHSHALEADAMHLRADIWTSAGVLIGLAIIKVTGLVWLDPLIAIGVALIVFKAGIGMTRKSLNELTDISLPPEEEKTIISIICRHEAVIAYHRLRTRRSGSYRLVDVHIIMDWSMALNDAHAISDSIEREIKDKLGLCDVVIHMEPCGRYIENGACPDRRESCSCEKEENNIL